MGLFDKFQKKKASSANEKTSTVVTCPACGGEINRSTMKCMVCGRDSSVCPFATGFNSQTQLLEKCSQNNGGDVCSANPYGYLYEDCQIYAAVRAKGIQQNNMNNTNAASILDKYRAGLAYLDTCGTFDEMRFRKFNSIIGERFSEADIQTQLANSRMMIRGMEDVKALLRKSMLEGIDAFEELERNGIDLSKLDGERGDAKIRARLVIVRDSSVVAAAVPTIITLNGQKVCTLKNGESAQIELTTRQNTLLTNAVGSANVRYEFETQNGAVGELHVKGGVFLPKTMRWN